MHTQITAEQYDSWTEEQCAGTEIVDGMVVVSPKAPIDVPVVYTDVLDPASRSYRDGQVFTGLVDTAAPFPVKIDLSTSDNFS